MNNDRLQLTIIWFIGVICLVLIVGSMLQTFHVDSSVANLISFGMGALATALRPRTQQSPPDNVVVDSTTTTTVKSPAPDDGK